VKSKYKSLGILIPSRERINLLENLLCSLANSPDSNFLEIIVASDNCPKTFESIKKFPLQNKFLKYKALITPKRLYTIGTIKFCQDNCDSSLFCWIANDVVLKRKDWISYLVNRFENFFPDEIGLGCLGCPGPAFGITTKKFVEYNDGEVYHNGYRLHYADMEVGVRAVLMGRYIRLSIFSDLKHKGGKNDIPAVSVGGFYLKRLEDKKLYQERRKERFFLDPKKIKNPKADEIFEKLEEGLFNWPYSLNIPF